MDKRTIRKQALSTRRTMPASKRAQKSIEIINKLESLDLFKESESVLFYYSQEDEVRTLDIMKKYITKKDLFLPRLDSSSQFTACKVSSLEELVPGAFGIMEPSKDCASGSGQEIDLIIIPGLAFDRQGTRLGMGKGYYDRFLSDNKSAKKVALAFSEQILEVVPKEPYDENVDLIITENEIIRP